MQNAAHRNSPTFAVVFASSVAVSFFDGLDGTGSVGRPEVLSRTDPIALVAAPLACFLFFAPSVLPRPMAAASI